MSNINLYIPFFQSKSDERQKELFESLKYNSENTLINKIYLILEDPNHVDERMNLKNVEIVRPSTVKRQSFESVFEFINSLKTKSTIHMISNADIYFKETLKELKELPIENYKKHFFALSRWQPDKNNKLYLFDNHGGSQDTWIFFENPEYNNVDVSFNFGIPGCDGRIARLMIDQGYIVNNPSLSIQGFHHHKSEIRSYQETQRLGGQLFWMKPIKIQPAKDMEGHFKWNLDKHGLVPLKINWYNVIKHLNLHWQEPVITEKTVFEQKKNNPAYIGIPWATVFDKRVNYNHVSDYINNILKPLRNNIHCFVTSCQHIHFRKLIPLFKSIGIKMLYVSHKTIGEDNIDGIEIKPMPLYAVNVEDSSRNTFKTFKKDLLYSFVGGNDNHYMSNIRQKIFEMNRPENVVVKNTGMWHFEKELFNKGPETVETLNEKREFYNEIMMRSRYTLCPSGSGPNSIRLWEALATGSIPVILSDTLELPKHKLWNDATLWVRESDVEHIPKILSNISLEKEEKMRNNCIQIYNDFKDNFIDIENRPIIHYCCASYFTGSNGGVARYDYQLYKIFPTRVFFQGPKEKYKLQSFIDSYKNPVVITDNHLSMDIQEWEKIYLVHHGCAATHAEREPGWDPYWKNLCCNGQNKMLTYRSPQNTTILSISQFCTDEFSRHYSRYCLFPNHLVLHPSELDDSLSCQEHNREKPVVLGNWATSHKGRDLIPKLKGNFEFQNLNVKLNGLEFEDFNKRKQKIYLDSDIFLQISVHEGNSYASLDAMLCGMVVVASDVGLFYKDVPEDCFVKLDWRRNNDVEYVLERLEYAWKNRESLRKNAKDWYMKNARFSDWEKKMKEILV